MEGVSLRRLVVHADERGSLTELVRSDQPQFRGFGQVMLTVNLPGVVRAWHWHKRQTDAIVVIAGVAKVGLYDARQDSATRGAIEEHVASGDEPVAIFVPPGVWHGYKTVSTEPAMIINCPDRAYDRAAPDEARAPANTPEVPYDWGAA